MLGRYQVWNGQRWVPCDFRLRVGVPGSTGSGVFFGAPVIRVWDGSEWCDVPAG